MLPESERQSAQVHPEQECRSAQGGPEQEQRSVPGHLEAVLYVPGAPQAWFELAARLLRAGGPAACRQAAAYARRGLLEAAFAWFGPAARPESERLTAAALAWCPRAVARPSPGMRPARRLAQQAASAAPAVVLPPEAVAVRDAPREAAAAEVLRALAAAVLRVQPAVLRVQPAVG